MKICIVCSQECGQAGVFRGADEPCCSRVCARAAYMQLGPYEMNDEEEKAFGARTTAPTAILFSCVVCGMAMNRHPMRDLKTPADSPECAAAIYEKDGPSKFSKDNVKPAWQVILPEDVPMLREKREAFAKKK